MTDATRSYALLILPAANRVYADASGAMTVAELGVLSATVLDATVSDVAETTIGGVGYVSFTAPPLSDRDVAYLSNLSSIYALFEREVDLLRPVPLSRLDQFDDDLITIPKYTGKTNEQFTKLLLNVTIWSARAGGSMLDRRLRVFDPLCGRGTTLNQALTYGYDAAGLDLDSKDFDAYATFLRTYFKRKRIKHHIEVNPVRRDRKIIARRLSGAAGASKERYKAGDAPEITVVNADTVKTRDFFRASSFDVIVADLPYGVQHGSRAPESGLARRPAQLLAAALPGWVETLRSGGAVGLSWNTYGASRDDVAELCEKAGLEVCDDLPYHGFAHRVDQAIKRDVIVATKPVTSS